MPFPTRFIHTAGNIPAAPPPEPSPVDSDVFTTLATLLCAIICILGLSFAARCVWMRRSSVDPPSRSLHNKGLKKKVLKTLPKAIFSTASSGKIADCAICLAEFSDGEEIRVLPECCHVFHLRCVDTWFGSHSSCPSCRHVLVAAACRNSVSRNSVSLQATEAGSGSRKLYEGDEHRFLP